MSSHTDYLVAFFPPSYSHPDPHRLIGEARDLFQGTDAGALLASWPRELRAGASATSSTLAPGRPEVEITALRAPAQFFMFVAAHNIAYRSQHTGSVNLLTTVAELSGALAVRLEHVTVDSEREVDNPWFQWRAPRGHLVIERLGQRKDLP
ncbi:MAG: hypothetical protein ACTH0V_05065 [Microbacteriaceae bacterium]